MTEIFNPTVISVAGAVLAVVLLAIIAIKRYIIARPDEAIIVTGGRGKGTQGQDGDISVQKVVTGGGVFVLPFVQKAFVLSLRSRRLAITTTAQTQNNITITAQAVAVIKVGGSESMIRAAAQRFLSQQDEIESSTREVLNGNLRGILGGLTVSEIIKDRAALASAVFSAAEEALTKQGLVIDTLQIQEIRDDQGYIENLGRPEAAQVRQEAEIADTNATRAAEQAKIEAEKSILDSRRELSLKEAGVKAETDKAAATAAAAKPLEDAIQRQRVVEQEELTAQREANLREQQLNAEVRKVADAEAYRIKVTAEADAAAQIAEAEAAAKSQIAAADAERQRRELAAQAVEREGQANRSSRVAQAEAVKAEGLAEAEAVKAKGLAEADAIAARADALAKPEAALLLAQQIIDMTPIAAEKLAAAYGSIDNLTIVSADGANKLTGDVIGNVTSVTKMLEDATGIDLKSIINGRVQGEATGAALGQALTPVQAVIPQVEPSTKPEKA